MNDKNRELRPPLGGEGYKVCVKCATFNHSAYIKATMDGFCIQNTNFPFVCVIIDDASTDGNQTIIKHYMHENFEEAEESIADDYCRLVAQHKENRNCNFVVYLLKENHYSQGKMPLKYSEAQMNQSQYIAMCEGDDYWTDKHKLQKQADALDANPQAVLVYTNFRVIDGEGNPIGRPLIERVPGRSHSGDNLPTLLRYGNYVMTLTTMCRNEVWHTRAYRNCPHKKDFGLTLAAGLMGDFIWLPEQTACYRSLESGMIRSGLRQGVHWAQDIYRYYARLVMCGQCKPLSFRQRCRNTTLILMRAITRKDKHLKKDTLKASPLSYLLLPIAIIKLKFKI